MADSRDREQSSVAHSARRRVLILNVAPQIDEGRFAAKGIVGERVRVEADLVADGHDVFGGALLVRHQDVSTWTESPLEPIVNDRWLGEFVPDQTGRWTFALEAWVDAFATWRRGLARKVEADVDVRVDRLVGAELVRAAGDRAHGADRSTLLRYSETIANGSGTDEPIASALSPELAELMRRYPDRSQATTSGALEVVVDRRLARFSAWYEMFPRSCGSRERHGTFRDAQTRLPYIAEMGFNVLYLPPIHPIGTSYRKGKNNSLHAERGDPGSPWAIGAPEGGHKSIHPELGTLEDFQAFRRAAAERGLELALDIAFQASPDHPWVREHPEWFLRRPDGSIQYAENPPKKYQDIYPINFDTPQWESLWNELLSVFLYWIDQGVRIFRVDNPHTKSLRFWEWCIGQIKHQHRDVLFLAEAFTRPKLMYALAKLGFSQSYTYFTWRNTAWEFREYLTELTGTDAAHFFRPNFWPNTPDILPEHLQHGGRPAFMIRLVLAATLSSNFGIYGPAFELGDHVARPGSEEYIDNEKYEFKQWDLDKPDSLRPLIARINRIRESHPALQYTNNLRFHGIDNGAFLVYSKRVDNGSSVDTVLVVVTLDPYNRQAGWAHLDLEALGLTPDETYYVHDLLSGSTYQWRGAHNFVDLNPHAMPAHIFHVERLT